jgi:hypothetical protein
LQALFSKITKAELQATVGAAWNDLVEEVLVTLIVSLYLETKQVEQKVVASTSLRKVKPYLTAKFQEPSLKSIKFLDIANAFLAKV